MPSPVAVAPAPFPWMAVERRADNDGNQFDVARHSPTEDFGRIQVSSLVELAILLIVALDSER